MDKGYGQLTEGKQLAKELLEKIVDTSLKGTLIKCS